ncbi:class I SAM-dependent methyltransferase [Pseudonocardia sichuanensis]
MSESAAISAYWDAAAPGFDDEPDHGLRDQKTREAWSALLDAWLPPAPAAVLDVGCGTGSLSALLAEAGHRVTGVDLSPRMVEQARAKLAARDLPGRFLVGDAAAPRTGNERFDVLLARHLLWTLPDPQAALSEWVTRVRPTGTLVLVEGRWREAGQTGVPYVAGPETLPWHQGIAAEDLAAVVRPLVTELRTVPLDNAALWGKHVTDERFALLARI